SRRMRLRITAFGTILLGTIKASRAQSLTFARRYTAKPATRVVLRALRAAATSAAPRRWHRRNRKRCVKRPGECGPWHDARESPRALHEYACGRGSRACACDGRPKVGKCASFLRSKTWAENPLLKQPVASTVKRRRQPVDNYGSSEYHCA